MRKTTDDTKRGMYIEYSGCFPSLLVTGILRVWQYLRHQCQMKKKLFILRLSLLHLTTSVTRNFILSNKFSLLKLVWLTKYHIDSENLTSPDSSPIKSRSTALFGVCLMLEYCIRHTFYRAALNAGRSSQEKAVCPSVCPSVGQTRALWQKGTTVQIFTPYHLA